MAFDTLNEFKINAVISGEARTGFSLDYDDATYPPKFYEPTGFELASEHSGVVNPGYAYYKEQYADIENTERLIAAGEIHADWRTQESESAVAAREFIRSCNRTAEGAETVNYKVNGAYFRGKYQPRGFAPGNTYRAAYTSGASSFNTAIFSGTLGHKIYFFNALVVGSGGNGHASVGSTGGGGGGGGGTWFGGLSFGCYVGSTNAWIIVSYTVGSTGDSFLGWNDGSDHRVRANDGDDATGTGGAAGGSNNTTWEVSGKSVVLWSKVKTGGAGGDGGLQNNNGNAGSQVADYLSITLVGTENFTQTTFLNNHQWDVHKASAGAGGSHGGSPDIGGGGGGGGTLVTNTTGDAIMNTGYSEGQAGGDSNGQALSGCGGGGGGGVFPSGAGTGGTGVIVIYY